MRLFESRRFCTVIVHAELVIGPHDSRLKARPGEDLAALLF